MVFGDGPDAERQLEGNLDGRSLCAQGAFPAEKRTISSDPNRAGVVGDLHSWDRFRRSSDLSGSFL